MPGVTLQTFTHPGDWVLVLPVVLSLAGAALLQVLRRQRELQWQFALLVAVAVAWCDLMLAQKVLADGPLSMTMGNWLPPFGISFTADIVGAVFALVAAVVTSLVLVYMRGDVPERAERDGVYSLVLVLLAGVSGSFLTGDMFNLYVWFEVMLIASFGLMVLGGQPRQLDATLKYGFLNFLATTIFLMALGLLYGLLGTLNMSDVARLASTANPATLASIAALLTLAFGMKAAAFPVNAWLPASYHAPPAALAALMAGLLTKVGVYALLRVLVMLLPASRDVLDPVITFVAVATLVLGPLGAIAETNLRRALGFLLIGGIGAVLAGVALPNPSGLAGSVTYIVNAMVTMTALYLMAGLIEAMTGETDSRRMGGIYAAASLPSALFFVLILTVAGLPPFIGFWPKLLLVQAGMRDWGIGTAASDPSALFVWVAVLLNAFLSLVAGSRLWAHIFWRSAPLDAPPGSPPAPLNALSRRARTYGLGATMVLTGAAVGFGLFPEPLLSFGRIAADGLLNPSAYIINATGLAEASP